MPQASQLIKRYFFRIRCGHSHCSVCLVKWIEISLAKKLQVFRFSNHMDHALEDCQTVPRSQDQLKGFNNALRTHIRSLQAFYTFECPTCRQAMTQPPVANFALNDFLAGIRLALVQSTDTAQEDTDRDRGFDSRVLERLQWLFGQVVD